MKQLEIFKTISTAIGGVCGYFWGGLDGFMIALIVCVAMDYLTGVMVAIKNKEVSSEIGFQGIFKKVMIFLLVGLCNIIDVNVLKSGNVIRTACIFFYLANEGISITENCGNMGLPIPKKLKDVLTQIKKESGEEDA